MPTTIKPSRRKPHTEGQPSRGLPRPRRTTQTARPRRRFPRTGAKPARKERSGLIGRAHATLPGRKPRAKKSVVKGMVSSLASAKSSAVARTPSKKGIVGILAGGLGVAAMVKRRRGANHDDMPTTPPLQPVEASGERPDSMAS
jgi:hypothetical protein